MFLAEYSFKRHTKGIPLEGWGCAHARSALSIMNLFKPKEDWGSPTNHITGFWTNEMAESSVQQPIRIGWLQLRPRPNNIYSDRIAIGILGFLTDHDDFYLWEMLQRIYREEHQKTHVDSSQTYSCGECGKEFSRADHRKRHATAHSYSLTCGVCGPYFNRLDSLARHRVQHERPEAKQRWRDQ
jgi:hypothetical protein